MDGFAIYRAVTPTCDKFLVNAQSGSQTMARISKELTKRCDGKTNLAPRHVIVVRVAFFAFRFETAERLRECIKYYEKKTRPSSRIPAKTLAADLGGTLERTTGMGRGALV